MAEAMSERSLIGFVYNPRVSEALEVVGSLVKSLGLEESSWVVSATELDVDANTLDETSLIVTAGGDGTILRTVRIAAPHAVPIVGVNMGRVGFMTELTVEDAKKRIPDYIGGKHRVEERMMLQASVITGSDGASRMEVHALNDVVVSRGAVPQLLDIGCTIYGASLVTYRADGVIAATATGSTGYALSAGGPIMFPEARAILIQPLAAHISLPTGLVAPEDCAIELRVGEGQEAVLSVDAFTDTQLSREDRVVVQSSPHVARFLRAEPPASFYETLTERLAFTDSTGR